MPYNIEAARKANISDQQIAEHLSKTFGYDLDSALKSGASHTQVAEYLSKNDKPPTRSVDASSKEPGRIAHAIGSTASGFNKGVANVVGFPVDIANMVLGATRLPVSKSPVMGSEWIKKHLMPEPVEPEGAGETMLNALAEQGAYVMPGIGSAARTGQALNALKTGAKIATGSGVGSGVARIVAPESEGLDVAAQLLGGGTVGGVNALWKHTRKLPKGAMERINLSKETGVKMSPADITGKKSDALIESQLEKNIGSTNQAQRFSQGKLSDVQKYATRLQGEVFGGRQDKLAAGQIYKEESWSRYNKFRENLSKIYNKIPINPSQAMPTSKLAGVASDHIDELGKLESPTIKRILGVAQKDTVTIPAVESKILGPGGKPMVLREASEAPAYDWKTLLRDQQILKKMQHSTPDYNYKRIYGSLIDAIDDDIAEFAAKASDPKIKKRLDAAVRYARSGAKGGANRLPGYEAWRNRQISNAMRVSDPEDIVDKFMRASDNRTDIQRLRDTAGPKGFQAIKQAWLQKGLTSGAEGEMSPAKFVTWYDSYRRGNNLDVILTSHERATLDKMYDLNKILLNAEKLAGNPSGTAQNLINSALSWARHPVRMTMIQIGANRFAKHYFSDKAFQKLVERGLKAEAQSKDASMVAKQLSTIAGVGLSETGENE